VSQDRTTISNGSDPGDAFHFLSGTTEGTSWCGTRKPACCTASSRAFAGAADGRVSALSTFLSADGHEPSLVAGSAGGHLRVYDPEAGSTLHRLDGHRDRIFALACIASSSAAPHHPRLVSTSWDGTAKVWDGETGEMLADLRGHGGAVRSVAVWKERTGGHDRIATANWDGKIKVWDGEAFTLLHDLVCGDSGTIWDISAFMSAEGPHRLLAGPASADGLQVWDPEEGRLLHDGINRVDYRGCPIEDFHLFESAQGRHLLAIVRRQFGGEDVFLFVLDLGEAPARIQPLRPANKQG
jgi:WD40 repeat protein